MVAFGALESFDYDEYLRLQEEERKRKANGGSQGLGGGLDWSENAAVLAWLKEEGAQNMLGGGESAVAAPAAVTTPAAPAVDWYEQTTPKSVVEAFISDRELGTNLAEFGDLTAAQEAWLDAATEAGIFVGNYGAVEGEGYSLDPSTGYILDETGNITGTGWGPGNPELERTGGLIGEDQGLFKDERYQGRIDFAESLLQQGYTVADIEQFLGVPSVGVAGEGFQDELGTVADQMVDPSFAGVGSDQWFDFLEAQDIEVLPEHREGPGSWFESPEFEAKYGDPAGDPVVEKTPQELCVDAGGTWNGVSCNMGGGNTQTPEQQCLAAGGTWNGVSCDMSSGMGTGDDDGEEDPPSGIPIYVNEQLDVINIFNERLKSIKDAYTKLQDSGLANIDEIEQALTDAESEIYEDQYGVRGPDGELLTPGEMDRLRSTFDNRRTTSKKNRTADRDEIVQIMIAEGVDPALAQSQLDMIQAIHGDSVDAQYDYIDSLWRIGKMSHDERTSMIGNMMASYRLQLRDRVIEMLMAEEVTTAYDIAGAQEGALHADTMGDMFEGMSENQVYALMRSGMTDLLQLPEDDPIGMISEGEWAGYSEGEKSNVLVNAGYTQNADGTFVAPADDAEDTEKTYKKTLPDGVTPFEGTPQEYFQLTGERMFAPDEAAGDDLGSFRGDVGVLREMGYGDWLDGQVDAGNLTIEGASTGSVQQGKVFPASDGYVTIPWADYPTEFDVPITPEEEAETTYQLPLSRFTSSAAELRGMGATVSGDTVTLSPQLATDLMALGLLKDVEEEEDPYDPFERFNTGVPESFLDGASPPVGAEIKDGELWMTPDGYSKFVDEMNYEEPTVATHGVDAGVSLDIAINDIAPPNYYDGMLRPFAIEWNKHLKEEEGDEYGYEDFGALTNAAIRSLATSYITEAKIIAHMDDRIVYGREAGARNVSKTSPGHSAGADAPAGKPYFAAVPVANGRIAMIYASSEQAVKDAVKQAYPDKR